MKIRTMHNIKEKYWSQYKEIKLDNIAPTWRERLTVICDRFNVMKHYKKNLWKKMKNLLTWMRMHFQQTLLNVPNFVFIYFLYKKKDELLKLITSRHKMLAMFFLHPLKPVRWLFWIMQKIMKYILV